MCHRTRNRLGHYYFYAFTAIPPRLGRPERPRTLNVVEPPWSRRCFRSGPQTWRICWTGGGCDGPSGPVCSICSSCGSGSGCRRTTLCCCCGVGCDSARDDCRRRTSCRCAGPSATCSGVCRQILCCRGGGGRRYRTRRCSAARTRRRRRCTRYLRRRRCIRRHCRPRRRRKSRRLPTTRPGRRASTPLSVGGGGGAGVRRRLPSAEYRCRPSSGTPSGRPRYSPDGLLCRCSSLATAS